MILLRGSVWVRLAYLLGISCGELALWRAQWAVDTANRAHFRTLRVRSGQQLQVEGANDTPDQPIVHYQTPAGHSHRLRIYMKRARLSPESQAAFAEAHQLAPKGDAVLKIAPDPQYEHVHGHECSVNLLIGFSDAGGQSPRDAKRRTVLLYPSQSQAGESSNSDSVRTVHVQSSSELAIRFSTNSVAGKQGPRCRSVLTMQQDEQSWPSPLGMDWEWTFIAAENSDIRVTFSPDMWTGEGEIGFGQELDSLALEPIQPRRLTVLGFEGSHVVVSRERTGQPFLTANTLKLGPDFLDVGLDGKAGIPIRELLASWQWAAGAIVNGSLLGWWLSGVMGRRDRVFLSYSRADESRVMEIYDVLERAGAKPWIDRRNIPGGARWRALIEKQMRNSRHVLVLLSDHAVKTGGYFWMEMEVAVSLAERRRRESFLIPVKLENCELPEVLTPYNALSLDEPGGRERLIVALGLRLSNTPVLQKSAM